MGKGWRALEPGVSPALIAVALAYAFDFANGFDDSVAALIYVLLGRIV
jgi:hypothetical protein